MSVCVDDGGPDLERASMSDEMWGWHLYCSGRLSHTHFSKNLNTTKKCLHGILHCIQSGHVHEGSPVAVPKSTVCNLFDDPLIVNTPVVISWLITSDCSYFLLLLFFFQAVQDHLVAVHVSGDEGNTGVITLIQIRSVIVTIHVNVHDLSLKRRKRSMRRR